MTIREKILNSVGRKVAFKYPAGEKHRSGTLLSRSVVHLNPRDRGVPYWGVVDLIKFKNDGRRWIRIGYYRVVKGKLRWASQTTASFPIAQWKGLFKEARKQSWFRDALK